MNFKIKSIACAALVALLASCGNDEYEFDKLFPESYHSIVYLRGDMTAPLIVYETGEETTVAFPVMKGGSDPDTSAKVDVEACSQQEIDELNLGYVLVPEDCYRLQGDIAFAPKEQYKEASVTFNIEKLKAFIASVTDGRIPAIALKLANSDATINSDKSKVIRSLSVKRPSIGFAAEKAQLGFANGKVDVSVLLDAENQWDFDCELGYGDIESEVFLYNLENGTNYEPMPADAFDLSTAKLEFKKGSNSATATVALNDVGNSLPLDGEYLLPLTISNCSMPSFEIKPSTCYVVVSGEVTINLDMLSSPCTQEDDGAGLGGLIDDDPATFWHSVWKTSYLDGTYGHYFQVDLKTTIANTFKFRYETRDYEPVLPLEIKIFVSENGSSWKEFVALNRDNDGLCGVSSSWTSPDYQVASPIRFVRFCVMRSNNGRPGVDGGACTAIAGFHVWGK